MTSTDLTREPEHDSIGVESIVARGETVVHCFDFDDRQFAYFSRTADLFELSPESALALKSVEANGSKDHALDQVRLIFNAETVARVEKDLEVMSTLGLFEQERRPSQEEHKPVIDRFLAHRPRNLMFFLTERCNLKCVYCYESLSGVHDNGAVLKKGSGEVILRDFFDRSAGRKGVKITFFGGEPLSNWPVFKAMVVFAENEAARRGQGVAFTTTSNLTLLDEEKADFLVEHKFTVMVSIDGDKEAHDANRKGKGGRGTYDKVSANLRMLIEKTRAAGLRLPRLRATWVPGVGNRQKVKEHLLEFGTGEGLVNVGSASYDIDHEELANGDDAAAERAEAEAMGEIKTALSSGDFPSWMRDALQEVDDEMARETPHDIAKQQLCGVCRNMLAATPTGDFYLCHRYVGMEGFKLGNVNDGGLDEEKVADYYRDVQKSFNDGCGSCWARHLCKGTCSWLNSNEKGHVTTPRARTCASIRSSYERILGAYSVVREDPNSYSGLLREATQ